MDDLLDMLEGINNDQLALSNRRTTTSGIAWVALDFIVNLNIKHQNPTPKEWQKL
jgi:hypothetical protein